jgi:hypothetical protein
VEGLPLKAIEAPELSARRVRNVTELESWTPEICTDPHEDPPITMLSATELTKASDEIASCPVALPSPIDDEETEQVIEVNAALLLRPAPTPISVSATVMESFWLVVESIEFAMIVRVPVDVHKIVSDAFVVKFPLSTTPLDCTVIPLLNEDGVPSPNSTL